MRKRESHNIDGTKSSRNEKDSNEKDESAS